MLVCFKPTELKLEAKRKDINVWNFFAILAVKIKFWERNELVGIWVRNGGWQGWIWLSIKLDMRREIGSMNAPQQYPFRPTPLYYFCNVFIMKNMLQIGH